jgi:hypothetical protein
MMLAPPPRPTGTRRRPPPARPGGRVELTRWRWVRALLGSRALQPTGMLVLLFFFVMAILAGLAWTPVGSYNFGIVFVWIVWWALLILVLVPFFGRLWCTVCPIPAPGEWLQRRGVIRRAPRRLRTLDWHWPRRLRNIWLQNAGFLALALFSTVILTRRCPSLLRGVGVLSAHDAGRQRCPSDAQQLPPRKPPRHAPPPLSGLPGRSSSPARPSRPPEVPRSGAGARS